jgi:antirestriction protein ArdC
MKMQTPQDSESMSEFTPNPTIDRFIDALGANIIYFEADIAYYYEGPDKITTTPRGARSTAQHYTILLHELAHWTGHHTRLNRTFGWSWDQPLFAREEITAIVATFHLCEFFGLPMLGVPNQLGYADKYLPIIKDDSNAISYALHEGRRAAIYLHEQQGHGPVFPERVLFHSAEVLALASFSPMAPDPLPQPAPVGTSPLAPLIERFRTVPRHRSHNTFFPWIPVPRLR